MRTVALEQVTRMNVTAAMPIIALTSSCLKILSHYHKQSPQQKQNYQQIVLKGIKSTTLSFPQIFSLRVLEASLLFLLFLYDLVSCVLESSYVLRVTGGSLTLSLLPDFLWMVETEVTVSYDQPVTLPSWNGRGDEKNSRLRTKPRKADL